MNNIKIKISADGKLKKTIKVDTPSTWEECAPLQVVDMVNEIATIPDVYECKIALLRLALKGVNKNIFLSLDDAVILDMIPLIDWCFSKNLITPVLQKFRHQRITYYLPEEKLKNISCLEWWLADGYYQKYMETKEVIHIQNLIGTICRPIDKNKKEALKRDDVRVLLNSRAEAVTNGKKLRKLDDRIKVYLLFFFSGCKNWVYKTYKDHLFSDDNIGEGGTSVQEQNGNPFGWYGTFQQVAETGVFGDLNNILINVKFIDLCAYLVAKKIEQDRIERKRKEQKNKNNVGIQ